MSDEDLQAVPPLHDFESEEEVVEEAPPEPEEAPATPAPSPFPPAMVDAAGSFNDYRKTQPHDGYAIIRKWRDARFASTSRALDVRGELLGAEGFVTVTEDMPRSLRLVSYEAAAVGDGCCEQWRRAARVKASGLPIFVHVMLAWSGVVVVQGFVAECVV
eukprot:s807_g2.t1